MPDKHAFLSPSSAERWYHCNKSAWLCEQFPDLGSVFAAEGTEAHSLCEYLLGVALGRSGLVDPRPGFQYYSDEMEECCQGYVAYVLETVEKLKQKDEESPCVYVEQRVDLRKYIAEIGELAGMKKADIEKVKAFLSTADDMYRPSYGKVVESHPRQTVIIATVNGERGYLRDVTGNRRFWVVKCRQKEPVRKFSFTEEERDQIWAEAKYYWQQGEKLFLEGDLIKDSEEAQRSAMEADERQGMVEQYLDTLLPPGWNDMDLYERRNWLSDRKDPTQPTGTVRREKVCNAEIWAECFGRNPSDMKPADSYAIAALMSQVPGWRKAEKRIPIPLYGRQRGYERIPDVPDFLD
jgi:hypothetical protein